MGVAKVVGRVRGLMEFGSRVASRIPQRVLELGLAILFILVAALTLMQVVL